MADWIRMRSSLLTNPRVTRIARLLLADLEFLAWLGRPVPGDLVTARDESVTSRDVLVVTRIVIGGLLPTWSAVNDTAGRDGVVRHAALREVDDMAGIPGFGKALQAVNWLEVLTDEDGVRFVNFEEHNSPHKERSSSAKSNAERQAEYRARKRAEAEDSLRGSDEASDVTRDVTSNRRIDKSREEKINKGAKAPSSAGKLPACPYDSIVSLYHEVLPELPKVRLMPAKRKKALERTWKWVLTSERADGTRRAHTADQALTWLRDYFDRARGNDFLMGRTPRTGDHASWQCDLDFLLTDNGMKHVIEKTAVMEAG